LGEDQAPYRLLDGLNGLARLELPDAERCCGFGGPFSVTHPEISDRMLSAKLGAARQAGAEVLVVGDVGCFMHLSCGAAQSDPDLKVIHLAQALAGEEA
jgi:L-lactate dehydrogenase complex protein LldE